MAARSRNGTGRAKAGTRRTAARAQAAACRLAPSGVATIARDAVALAFDAIGGVAALAAWVKADEDNRKVFYTSLYPKLIALQVPAGEAEGPPPIQEIRRSIVRP
jgi:hypothetical protein